VVHALGAVNLGPCFLLGLAMLTAVGCGSDVTEALLTAWRQR
jgi:hypothetical protein